MPPRQPELGKRRTWVRRPNVNGFPPWDGQNREGDPAAIRRHQFRRLINVRIDDSEIRCRGGQRAINPNDPVEGCVTGVFPPEFRPTPAALNRLIVLGYGFAAPESQDNNVYVPAEDPSFHALNFGPGGIVNLYFDGARIIYGTTYDDDTDECVINEVVLNIENGVTVAGSMAGYVSVEVSQWDGTCGAIAKLGDNYYFHRYNDSATAGQKNRLEKMTFNGATWDVTNERNNDEATDWLENAGHMVVALDDGRLVWLSKSTSQAEVEVRSQSGVWTSQTLPSGWVPPVQVAGRNNQYWTIYNGVIYLGGNNGGGDAQIVTYDPVTNTSATARTFTGCDDVVCMAVHKSVLYFAYKTTGGAWRVGMLEGNTWTDIIFSFSVQANTIYDLASFKGRLYMTRGTDLEASTDPNLGEAFETIADSGDEHATYLLAVP